MKNLRPIVNKFVAGTALSLLGLTLGSFTALPTTAAPLSHIQPAAIENEASDIAENPAINVLAKYYGFEPAVVTTVMQDCSFADDTLVTLHLAKLSRTQPTDIVNMRKRSQSWQSIITKLNIAPATIFPKLTALKIDPQSRILGWTLRHYLSWENDPQTNALYDKAMRTLTAAAFLSNYCQVTPDNALKMAENAPSGMDILNERLQSTQP